MHIKQKGISPRLGPVSLAIFIVMLATITLCPSVQDSARATDGDPNDDTVSAEGDALAISISKGNLAMTADPTVNNGIVMGSVDVLTKTTNETGYSLKISTNNSTDIKSTDSSNGSVIPTLASSTTLASFTGLSDNRWGYHFGTTEANNEARFEPFSTSATEISSTKVANSTPTRGVLSIAAKTSTNLPASTYSTQLIISATTNLPKNLTSPDMTEMQEMNKIACDNTPEGYEKQLKDTRDGKMYWVRKQADGRCWMVQNLALDIPAEGLKASDTNIPEDWTKSSSRKPVATKTGIINWDTVGYYDVLSWNGATNYIINQPLYISDGSYGCGGGIKDLAIGTCKDYFTDTINMAPGYTANITSESSTSFSQDDYDAHYLVGNFYSYWAATAGFGSMRDYTYGSTTRGSICPRGWKLPTMRYDQNSSPKYTGDMVNLLVSLGYERNQYNSGILSTNETGNTLLPQSPLYFNKAGALSVATNGGPSVGVQYGTQRIYLWGDGGAFVTRSKSGSNSEVSNSISAATYYSYSVRCINDPSI